jgi:formate/nitrite transporter FocA (FNT family)
MTPKQTALTQTLKLFALAILAGVLINVAFAFFTIVQIGIALAVAVLAALGKMVYDIELSKAEHLKSLNELNRLK